MAEPLGRRRRGTEGRVGVARDRLDFLMLVWLLACLAWFLLLAELPTSYGVWLPANPSPVIALVMVLIGLPALGVSAVLLMRAAMGTRRSARRTTTPGPRHSYARCLDALETPGDRPTPRWKQVDEVMRRPANPLRPASCSIAARQWLYRVGLYVTVVVCLVGLAGIASRVGRPKVPCAGHPIDPGAPLSYCPTSVAQVTKAEANIGEMRLLDSDVPLDIEAISDGHEIEAYFGDHVEVGECVWIAADLSVAWVVDTVPCPSVGS